MADITTTTSTTATKIETPVTPRFETESGDRWLRIRPSTANAAMVPPPVLVRSDTRYDTDSPHLVVPPATPASASAVGLCHVYLHGTGCSPTEANVASWLLSVTGDRGVATIALSYQFGPYADKERNELLDARTGGDNAKTQEALRAYHADTVYGGESSGLVQVSPCNSIMGRLVSLLRYLRETRPASEDWGSFLRGDGIASERFVFSGHSQGSGHACFVAKELPLKKAVLFSGPQEHLGTSASSPTTPSTSWLDGAFATNYVVALMHQDEEGTADLIRGNWLRIAPLQGHSVGRVLDVRTATASTSAAVAPFTRGDRMFVSTVAPAAPWDACGGRPNHMSMVSDRNTPTVLGPGGEVRALYYDLIWSYLFLHDMLPSKL